MGGVGDVIKVPRYSKECIRGLGLYSRDSLVDDVTCHYILSTRWNVNNNGNDVRKLPRYIIRFKTNC